MTTGDDRDRVMDTLLSGALSSGQTARQAVAAPCVDAETLAAWVDHALPASAAAQVESHVSSCSRCQAVMAIFLRTTPEPAAPESLWQKWRLGWLVPLTGAAAALAIYVASRPPAPTAILESDQARVERAAEPLAAPESAPIAAPEPAPTAPQASVLSERRADADARVAQPPAAVGQAAPGGPSAPAPQQNSARDQLAREEQSQTQTLQAPAEKAAVSAEAAAPQAAPPAAPPAPARPAVAATAARAFAVAPSIDVVSAGAPDRWRIQVDGTMSRSTDGGATWQALSGRVSPGIRAGSSPSAGVCWLVGDNGAVWLTTDGMSFRRLTFPEPAALTGVAATSARAATVTGGDGRAFRTIDQGAAWQSQ